jgi:hypothetical protein
MRIDDGSHLAAVTHLAPDFTIFLVGTGMFCFLCLFGRKNEVVALLYQF